MLSSGFLLQVIRKLGGDVTVDGNMSTHIVTSKVRKTLNFCTALCSGLVSKLTSIMFDCYQTMCFIIRMVAGLGSCLQVG